MKNNKSKYDVRDIIYIALFAAVMSVLSQISLPLPGGVPVTLQTFGAALVGYMLGAKKGAAAIAVHVLLGAAGVPVFAGFRGGLGSVTGQLGGFIWGFILMAFLCGLGAQTAQSKISDNSAKPMPRNGSRILAVVLGLAGLALCHICGIMQWAAIKGGGIYGSFLTVSAPFLLKDAVSVGAAYAVSETVAKRVNVRLRSSRQA